MAEIALENLTKVYPDGTEAVTGLDLDIGDGEFVVFVGPSGCGKTTALRMIAGLESITDGTVKIEGEVVNDLPPKDRDVAMVFQNYALYPHMNAADNMGFALKMRGVPKSEVSSRVREAAVILGLTDALGKKPRTLSGGQRQRVAMGRAIVRQPQAFLMDEPLSNLDAKLRVEMRAEIARIQRDLSVTTVYVTHDQTEAMTMGDRVAVMRNGLLQQVAPPQVLYERPTNLFVAEFIGSPAMNLVQADLATEDGATWVRFAEHRLRLDRSSFQKRPALSRFQGRPVVVGIRPEDIEDAAVLGDTSEDQRIVGRLRHPGGHGQRGVHALQRRRGGSRDEGGRRGARRGRARGRGDEAGGRASPWRRGVVRGAPSPRHGGTRAPPARARRRRREAALLRPRDGPRDRRGIGRPVWVGGAGG